MRVTDHHIGAGPETTGQAERAGESTLTGQSAVGSRLLREDRVEVDAAAGYVARALSAASDVRQARVQELRATWERGTYAGDPARIGSRMVDHLLCAR
jgi:flagellar biosynthesis anti-sigma factor FlgM